MSLIPLIEADLDEEQTEYQSKTLHDEVPSQDEKSSQDLERSVVKSTAGMTLATLISRVTGLVRTWAMAFALGNTLLTSAYQVANNLPNVIYDLVAGGLLAAAFLPVLVQELERKGQDGFNRFGSNILNICLVLLGILSLLCIVFAGPIVFTQTFTVDQGGEVATLATRFFQIFAIQLLFYGLGGVITGILNSRRSYFLTSIAPALNNVCVIIGFFAYVPLSSTNPDLAIMVLAVLTTLGVAVQFVIQIPALRKVGFSWQRVLDFRDPALVETLNIAIPTLIFIVGNLIAFSCRNAFSLLSGDEGPSMLSYAWMWFQLPYGVVAVSLSRAMFTEQSLAVAKEDWDSLRRYVTRGLRGTLFLIIPLAGLMYGLCDPIIGVFRAGAFTADDVVRVADVLRIWVLGLPLYAVYMYMYNTFASIHRFLPFALLNCVLVVVQIVLYALLSRPETLGIIGVPLADIAYYLLGAVLSLVLLQRMVGAIELKSLLVVSAKSVVAAVVSMFAALLVSALLPFNSINTAYAILEICVGGIAGLAVFFVAAKLFRIEEMSVVNNILARFKR